MQRKVSGKLDIMKTIAAGIVKGRFMIYALFLGAVIYCVLSIGKVQINNDLTAFLPSDTETRRGLSIMEEEFTTYASANIMVSNITYEHAAELAASMEEYDGVFSVAFDDSRSHYVNTSAMLSVSFEGTDTDETVLAAMEQIRTDLSDYDTYISTTVGEDYTEKLAGEMVGVLLIAALVIVAVLLFTSRSYFEVVIFFLVFAVAAILNMGTNHWLGEISSITNSIAVVMQLALAIDYAIILSHRYQDEATRFSSKRQAMIEALSKAIVEISASSLTTISGLVALTLMQFRLGYDLGIVLSKGILCSLLTVFLLMPGLILLFPKALQKTAHKTLVPNMQPWGKFLVRGKYVFVILFVLVLPFSIVFSERTHYVFADSSINELVYSQGREAMHKITNTFDESSAVAVLVPAGSPDKEKAALEEIARIDHVKSVMGLSNIEIEEGRVLTDSYTPRMLSELLDIDIELSNLLFQAYGVEHDAYQAIFGDTESYAVPLIDMFSYLFEKIDQGIVTLDDAAAQELDAMREMLTMATDQLQGENWNRMVLTASVPPEGEESLALTQAVREAAEKYYGKNEILVVGDITSTHDLSASFHSDSTMINVLTILFVFLILLFTFRSVAGAVILVFVIQGSIWLNFACTYLAGDTPSFVTNMIVSAIQMGATIDYAIVLMNRYQTLKQTLTAKEAMVQAVNQSFTTIFTSGSIMTVAGFLIAYRISDVYVGHIGLAVGRGALISIILVLTVLPQLICLLDKVIDKTKFQIHWARKGEDLQ